MTLEQWARHPNAVAGLWWSWVVGCALTGGTIAYRLALRWEQRSTPPRSPS